MKDIHIIIQLLLTINRNKYKFTRISFKIFIFTLNVTIIYHMGNNKKINIFLKINYYYACTIYV